ncbi:MAG TPA: beta-eliminating lyase-related protein [Streptosporangiaceae bacterium]|nr:beta-eliminating lyase-related protein [Streptosporangiaceae bacterium]
MTEYEDMLARRGRCSRFLHGHGPATAASMLATIPADTTVDSYGKGGAVAELEARVCELLGKPAAVFLPSGTMGQQAVLRAHADERGRRTVLFHPMCHLERHEEQGYQRLHSLIGRPVGDLNRLITLDDLAAVAEPAAALLLELPQRDLGGQQPAFDELAAQVSWAHDQGAAAHLDGARLWESAAGYGQSPDQVAAVFDTVYVSFYKGIGALPGCCVAGPEHIVGQVRDWRRRMGGTVFGLWPSAASALTCLAQRLPRFPAYLERARALAAALAGIPGVTVVPDPPQVPMMHVLLAVSKDDYVAAARELAEDRGIWIAPDCLTTTSPGVQRIELSVGDATLEFEPAEVAAIFAGLISAASG